MQSILRHGFISSSVFISSIGFSAATVVECKVPFAYDSAVVRKKAVDACIETLQLRAKSGEELRIVASATPPGTSAYNQALSQRRARNLQQALQQRIPGLKVDAKGIGEIPKQGLIARIVAEEPAPTVMSNAEQEARDVARETVKREEITASVGTSDAVKTATIQPVVYSHWRVGPRLGRDHTRIEDKGNYFAPGIDVAYVPRLASPNLRVEVGAIGNVYTEIDTQRMNSIHFAPMIGYQNSNGMIAGVRALVGVVNSKITDDSINDSGLELRLGYEAGNWSTFLGIGETTVLDRIGLDLGYRF